MNVNERQMNRLLMEKVSKKFYGHDTLKSKYEPQIPLSAEREYVRTTNAYMAILKSELEEQLPKLKEAYKKERDADVKNQRNDSATDLQLAITGIFNTIKNNVIARTIGFGLRRKLENLAHLNRKLTVKEWKRAIKATLGIDIREDYYLGSFFEKELAKWIDENVGLIKTIPENTLDKMRDIVYDGFANGKTTTLTSRSGSRRWITSTTAWATPPLTAKPRPAAVAPWGSSPSSSAVKSTSLASNRPISSSKVSTKSTSLRTERRLASSFLAAQGPIKQTRALG